MNNKLKVLKTVAEKFNQAGVNYAVGSSVLLFFNGIVDEFHDLDILIDYDDTNKVKNILNDLGTLKETLPNSNYKSKTFLQYVVDGVDIDIIGGFIIVKDGIEYDCSLQKDITNHVELDGIKINLDTLDNWKRYYSLMNREYKAKMIEDYQKDISTK